MKKLKISFLILFLTTISYSQTFEPIKKGFDIESGIFTDKTITIEGKTFDLFSTKNGSVYIKCLSGRTGKYYPLWIGEKTELIHEGKPVYKSKNGKFCIYLISKNTNYPYSIWLKEQKQ